MHRQVRLCGESVLQLGWPLPLRILNDKLLLCIKVPKWGLEDSQAADPSDVAVSVAGRGLCCISKGRWASRNCPWLFSISRYRHSPLQLLRAVDSSVVRWRLN